MRAKVCVRGQGGIIGLQNVATASEINKLKNFRRCELKPGSGFGKKKITGPLFEFNQHF